MPLRVPECIEPKPHRLRRKLDPLIGAITDSVRPVTCTSVIERANGALMVRRAQANGGEQQFPGEDRTGDAQTN